jgi:hypothetical protein
VPLKFTALAQEAEQSSWDSQGVAA